MATSNLKHTWSVTVKNDSGSAVLADPALVLLGDAEANWSIQVAPGEIAEVDAAVTVAKIVSGFVSSNTPVTVFTNTSNGSGGQAFVLPGNESVAWNNTQGSTSPFTTDVTKWFVDNSAGTKIATVRGGFLLQE